MHRAIALALAIAFIPVAMADNPKSGKGTATEMAEQASEVKNGKDTYCNRRSPRVGDQWFDTDYDDGFDPLGKAYMHYIKEFHRLFKLGK